MNTTKLHNSIESPPADAGAAMYALVERLFPICRSISGDGLRQTLQIIGEQVPLTLHEVPSGTKVFDWIVPDEWNIRDAYVKDSRGNRVIDFQMSNLHVVNYSQPVRTRLRLAQLKEHLFTLPEKPDWIPYRTSYYAPSWGFCVSHNQMVNLKDDEYEVVIDSTLAPGAISYGEALLKGTSDEEFLISCHCCHPSLANDNLSGVALATKLYEVLAQQESRRISYRFLFIPGTIGSIAWLARNEDRAKRIKHGLVVSCVGDRGSMTYKKSRRSDAIIDRAAMHVLKHRNKRHQVIEFSPWGYDERQYCSPGFDLPVGSLMRSRNGEFRQYHTSADDLELVDPGALADSLDAYLSVIELIENNRTYLNNNPKCEPQLGRRGLYDDSIAPDVRMAMLWVLNFSDGQNSLLDIAERSNIPFTTIHAAAMRLRGAGLLQEVA